MTEPIMFAIPAGFFNTIHLSEEFKVDGDDLLMGGRTIERRRDGTVVRDEVHWNLRLVGGASYHPFTRTAHRSFGK